MSERSFAEFLAALEQQAAQDDEDERTLLEAGAQAAKAVMGVARTMMDKVPQKPTSERRPMFCPQCGTELKPEWRFCTKCGATIER